MNDLVLNASYYIQITKSNSTSSSFEAVSQFNSMVACSPYNLTCGELITNGGFDNVSQPLTVLTAGQSPFGRNFICDWDFGHETPQIQDFNTNPSARMWVEGATIPPNSGLTSPRTYGESILKSIQLTQNKTYLITFKLNQALKGNGDPYNLPDVFRIKLLHSNNVPQITGLPQNGVRNPLMYDFSSSISQDIVEVPESAIDLDKTTWDEFTFCFTANADYDRILFYPYELTIFAQQDWILLDDVSLKEFVVDAGNDITTNSSACSVPSVTLNGSISCMPVSSNYTFLWTPSTGLSDPTILNPTITEFPYNNITYSLNVTYNNGSGLSSCTVSDQVIVYGSSQVLADGSNLGDLRTLYSIPGANSISGVDINITGTFYVNSDFTFDDCNFFMDEGARIIVSNGAELTLVNGTVFNSCDPEKFWNSIIVKGNTGASIDINNCEFYNSLTTITINNDHADFEIKNSLFENNQLALSLNLNTLADANHAIISGNTFKCSTTLNDGGADFYPTFAAKIIRYKFSSTSIKQKVEFSNNTVNGSGGKIYLYESPIDVDNNTFKGFNNTYTFPGQPSKEETALWVNAQLGNTSMDLIKIQNNTFESNYNSITCDKDNNLEIYNNRFDNTGIPSGYLMTTSPILNSTAIGIKNNSLPTSIDANSISIGLNGIVITNCSDVEIVNNKLRTFNDGFNEDYYFSTGISVNNPNITSSYSTPYVYDVNIEDNSIAFANTGIYSNMAFVSVIRNYVPQNDIVQNYPTQCGSFSNPCPPLNIGIRVMNNVAEIRENFVRYWGGGTANFNENIGISFENAAYPSNYPNSTAHPNYVNCNFTERNGIGIRFMGNCEVNTEVMNNDFLFHDYGIVLDQDAVIGDIGGNNPTPTNPNQKTVEAGNDYQGTFLSQTYNFSYWINQSNPLDNANPSHMVLNNSNPPVVSQFDAAQPYSGQTKTITTVTNPLGSPNDLVCSPPPLDSPPPSLVKKVNFYNNNLKSNSPNKWMQRGITKDSAFFLYQQLMYHHLIKDTVNLFVNPNWKQFSDSMKLTSFGKLKGRSNLAINNANNFDQLLMSISPILIKHKSDVKLNHNELDLLKLVALKCPYDDGIAVYYSRSVLNEYGYPNYFNICERTSKQSTSANYRKTLKNPKKAEGISVYPNPSQGIFSLKFNVDENVISEINLYSMHGKRVYNKKLKPGLTHNILTESLSNGIYLLTLKENGNEVFRDKLIIQ